MYVLIIGCAVIDKGKGIKEHKKSSFFKFILDLEQKGGYVV